LKLGIREHNEQIENETTVFHIKPGIRVHNEHIENETTVFHIKPYVLPTNTCLTISTNGSRK